MKLTIKQVEGIDIGHVKKLVKALYEEMGITYPVFNEEEFDRMMMQILINLRNPLFVYLIAYDGKKPAGYIMGYVGTHPYGKPSKVAVCQELYVIPGKRGSFIGYRLIQKAINLCLEQGVEGFECIGGYGTTDKRWQDYGFKMHLAYGHMSPENMTNLMRRKKNENLPETSY
jgi:GNAT superfamily N-acetyltransferase